MGLIDLITGSEVKNLREVLIDELKDLFSAENQLVKALPKMEKKAASPQLKLAFRSHLSETKNHVERLKDAGKALGTSLTGKSCKAMEGLVKEGGEVLEQESKNPALIDALLIGAAQRVEHYEIAAYGTARAMAEELGEAQVVKLLNSTIKEEGAADKKLTEISLAEVLPSAFKSMNTKVTKERSSQKVMPQKKIAKKSVRAPSKMSTKKAPRQSR